MWANHSFFLGIWNRKKIGFHFKTFPFQTTSHITEYVIIDNGLFQLYIVMDIEYTYLKTWFSGIKYLKPGFLGLWNLSWKNSFLNEAFFFIFLLKFLAVCRTLKTDFVYTRSVTSYKCLLLLSDHFSFPTAFVKRVLEIWIYLSMKIFQNAVLTLVKRLITNSVKKLYYYLSL